MTLKYRILVYVALFVGIGLYWLMRKHDKHVDNNLTTTVLPPQDKQKIIVDPAHHTITTVTQGRCGVIVKKEYLNPRGVTDVEETKTGQTQIQQRTYGVENIVRVGVTYGSDLNIRAALGLDVLYWHGFDFGPAIFSGLSLKSTRLGGYLVYNAYDNVSVGPYIDNHHDFGVMLSVRF